jgi:hypothetical protein
VLVDDGEGAEFFSYVTRERQECVWKQVSPIKMKPFSRSRSISVNERGRGVVLKLEENTHAAALSGAAMFHACVFVVTFGYMEFSMILKEAGRYVKGRDDILSLLECTHSH